MKKSSTLIFLVVLLYNSSILLGQQLAFPGAEGFGKYTTGGRGGIVVQVTNLNDAGAGSLRDALTGSAYKFKKRTVVFKVSGTIELLSQIQVKYDSCITIAGQTAPGDGICIKNYPISLSDSKNIIIRYIRFRLGDEQICDTPSGGCDLDAFSVRKCHHVILDHCSFSWSIDDLLDLTVETGYTTVQYCILSEALNNSKHSKGAHGYAAGWDGYSYGDFGVFAGSTFHHNLIAICNSRTPRLDAYAGESNNGRKDIIDLVNNVIYNWSSYGAYGGEHADVNWQNNYHKYGLNTGKKDQIFQPDGTCKVYLSGNYVDGYPLVTNDNTKGIYVGGSKATISQLDTIIMSTPFEVWPVNMESSQEAFNNVLANAGAILPARDSVDSRIVNNVRNRSGQMIDSQSQVDGWPLLKSITPTIDTDKDGMPDDWEILNGLNPNNDLDRNGDVNNNGYTNLEDYLNGIQTSNSVKTRFLTLRNCRIYPNPFKEQTTIEIDLSQKSKVVCSVIDITGKSERMIANSVMSAGKSSILWQPGVNSPMCQNNGIYICRIEINGEVFYRKIIYANKLF